MTSRPAVGRLADLNRSVRHDFAEFVSAGTLSVSFEFGSAVGNRLTKSENCESKVASGDRYKEENYGTGRPTTTTEKATASTIASDSRGLNGAPVGRTRKRPDNISGRAAKSR